MSLRLGCGTAGTAFGQQNIANSNQPKQRSQRLNSSRSRHAPTHIEQWISSISTELQILLPLEYPWLHVTKPCFLLVKYCMLLTRHSLKDSCSAVFELLKADTMQNIAFALFYIACSFLIVKSCFYWFYIACRAHPKVSLFFVFTLNVDSVEDRNLRNTDSTISTLHVAPAMQNPFLAVFQCMGLAPREYPPTTVFTIMLLLFLRCLGLLSCRILFPHIYTA